MLAPSLRFARAFVLAASSILIPIGIDGGNVRADDDDWKALFNGRDLDGWTVKGDANWRSAKATPLDPKDDKRFALESGEGILVNGQDGKAGNLFTVEEFGDLELEVEFVVPRGSNSGVYLQARYEIQILDSHGVEHPKYSDCGGIYQRWKDNAGFEGHAPKVNASKAPGEWQKFEIRFRAPRFDAEGKKSANARFERVTHNGKKIHEDVEVTGPTRAAAFEEESPLGPLMFQGDHGPVALRNLRVRPLAKK